MAEAAEPLLPAALVVAAVLLEAVVEVAPASRCLRYLELCSLVLSLDQCCAAVPLSQNYQ
jgi:hypothetical protein